MLPNLGSLSLSSVGGGNKDDDDDLESVLSFADADTIAAALEDVENGVFDLFDDSEQTGAPVGGFKKVDGAVRFIDLPTNLRPFYPKMTTTPQEIPVARNDTNYPLYESMGRYHKDVMDAALQGAWNPGTMRTPKRFPVALADGTEVEGILGHTILSGNVTTGVHESATEIFVVSTVQGSPEKNVFREGRTYDASFYGEAFMRDLHAAELEGVSADELPPLYQWAGNYNEYKAGAYNRLIDLGSGKIISFLCRRNALGSFSCYGRAMIVRIEQRPAKAYFDSVSDAFQTARRIVKAHKTLRYFISAVEKAIATNTSAGYKLLTAFLGTRFLIIRNIVEAKEQLKRYEAEKRKLEIKDILKNAIINSSKEKRVELQEISRRFYANDLLIPFITFRLTDTTFSQMRKQSLMRNVVPMANPSNGAAQEMKMFLTRSP